MESLLLPENKDKLVEILTYHVVPAKVMSGDIAGKRAKVLTVQGDRLSVNAKNGVRVNGADVVQPTSKPAMALSMWSMRLFCPNNLGAPLNKKPRS